MDGPRPGFVIFGHFFMNSFLCHELFGKNQGVILSFSLQGCCSHHIVSGPLDAGLNTNSKTILKLHERFKSECYVK